MMKLTRRALIVEDDLETWKPKLEALYPTPDWELVFTATAEEAEEKFRADNDWDLVVVDYQLEGERTGHDFLVAARDLDTNVPIVLFTEKRQGFGVQDMDLSGIT